MIGEGIAGKQWFFSKESLESLIKAYEAKRQKEERHQIAQDTLGHDRGRPRTTADMAEPDRTPPLPDEKRAEALQDLLKEEKAAHAKTRQELEQKLEQKQNLVLEKTEAAARLEGEKEAYEKYITQLRTDRQEIIGMLRDAVLKLQPPPTSNNIGHGTADDRGQPRSSEDMAEAPSAPARPVATFTASPEPAVPQPTEQPAEEVGETQYPTPPESPQNDVGEEEVFDIPITPTSESATPPEQNLGGDWTTSR